jgi:hypothetical protein
MSGYLIPHLLPTATGRGGPAWGELGSRVRGMCYNHTGKGYGFLRYMKTVSPELWKIDPRQPDSPYDSVFFHNSQLPSDVRAEDLPSRSMIFEFELTKAEGRENGVQAINMQLISPRRRPGPYSGSPSSGQTGTGNLSAASAGLPATSPLSPTPAAVAPVPTPAPAPASGSEVKP